MNLIQENEEDCVPRTKKLWWDPHRNKLRASAAETMMIQYTMALCSVSYYSFYKICHG